VGDVLVLGGGPAGSSAASLLAGWGHRVRLITRQPGDARLAVSVPPSTERLFDATGISSAIAGAGFIRSTGNTVWWGADTARVESFADGARGWQVPTDHLERVLIDHAAAAGVAIERRPIVEADFTVDSFVIDATGRSGVLARAKSLREYDEGPRTVALVGEWQRETPWGVPDQSHTLVESYQSGWAWSVPVVSLKPQVISRHLAVMVDPQRSGLSREGSARAIYEHEIAKTRRFRSLVEGARLTGGPWGWDASTYRARHYAGDGWLLAGDAGWFVDPLSSAGVKKALASGWLAAIVANTSMTRPEMRAHAQQFFSDRETELERHFTGMSRSFLAQAAPNHPHAFWIDRADTIGEAGQDTAAIQAAFEQLRAADDLRVHSSPALQIEPRPMIEGREIVLRPHIVWKNHASGIRYLNDVDVVVLVELAPRCREVPELVAAYQERMGPVPFPNVLRALAGAIAKGWLVRE
jgi:flavin-dependent dehydrogenase